jgi:chromosome segregation ATPase
MTENERWLCIFFLIDSDVAVDGKEHNSDHPDIAYLQKRAVDLEEESNSLKIKLDHRTEQVEELQREMSAQSKEISTCQKELRKAKSQLTTMERQLNDKVYEVTQLMSHATEVEDQLNGQKKVLDSCRKELKLEKERTAALETAKRDIQKLHQRQCEELQLQVEKVCIIALLTVMHDFIF